MTHPTNSLPPEAAGFAALIDAQPAPVRDAFNYLLCLAMTERGALRLIETHSGAVVMAVTPAIRRFAVLYDLSGLRNYHA